MPLMEFILLHLQDCMIEVRPCVFRKYYLRALYYLTAHYLVMYKDVQTKAALAPGSTSFAAGKGVISSTSVGDLSLTKEMPEYNKTSDDKFLASTLFGQEFIRLRNKMTKGPLLANQVHPSRTGPGIQPACREIVETVYRTVLPG